MQKFLELLLEHLNFLKECLCVSAQEPEADRAGDDALLRDGVQGLGATQFRATLHLELSTVVCRAVLDIRLGLGIHPAAMVLCESKAVVENGTRTPWAGDRPVSRPPWFIRDAPHLG